MVGPPVVLTYSVPRHSRRHSRRKAIFVLSRVTPFLAHMVASSGVVRGFGPSSWHWRITGIMALNAFFHSARFFSCRAFVAAEVFVFGDCSRQAASSVSSSVMRALSCSFSASSAAFRAAGNLARSSSNHKRKSWGTEKVRLLLAQDRN